MASREKVLALHRYFFQANQMRTYYDARLLEEGVASVEDAKWIEQWIDLCLWYACLYVVIEGWVELSPSDPHVDDLLKAPHVDLLRRFGNGVMHYQSNYWDERFLDFTTVGADSAVWARNLNTQFGRFFLEWFQSERKSAENRN